MDLKRNRYQRGSLTIDAGPLVTVGVPPVAGRWYTSGPKLFWLANRSNRFLQEMSHTNPI
jgi:hypothetical protein